MATKTQVKSDMRTKRHSVKTDTCRKGRGYANENGIKTAKRLTIQTEVSHWGHRQMKHAIKCSALKYGLECQECERLREELGKAIARYKYMIKELAA